MYCRKCGKKLNDSDLFCTACGNKIERVKLVFTKGVEGYFGRIGIYIDDNKIGRIKYKQQIETYVTIGQHKLDIKDYRLVTNDYILNITPDIKTVYIHLYFVSTYPRIKIVKVEKIISNEEQNLNNYEILNNKLLVDYNNQTNSNSQQTTITEDDNSVVKNVTPVFFWSPTSFLLALLSFCLEQILLGIIAIIFGIIGVFAESHNKTAKGFAIAGIIIGIFAVVYKILLLKPGF